jgi:DNA repair exonuclease SbcCD ATPase subunit
MSDISLLSYFYCMTHTLHTFKVVLFTLILLLCATAYAEESVPAENTSVLRMNQEERMGQRAERRGVLSTQLQERITNLANNIKGRFTAAIERLGKIIVRLDSRIEKLKANDVDTAAAEAKLADAKDTLEEAKERVANLESFWAAISGDTPRESFAAIREEFKAIRDLLQKTRAEILETVALLKESVRTAESARGVSDAVSTEPAEVN